MHVLIVDDDATRQADLAMAFMRAGFQPTVTASQNVAERTIRRDWVDLLVMSERVGQRLTHGLALLAEWRNPQAATMLLTPRTGDDVQELFLLIPSLHCLLAPDIDAGIVAKFATASVTGRASRTTPMLLSPELRIDDATDAIPIFATSRGPMPHDTDLRRYA